MKQILAIFQMVSTWFQSHEQVEEEWMRYTRSLRSISHHRVHPGEDISCPNHQNSISHGPVVLDLKESQRIQSLEWQYQQNNKDDEDD